MQWYSHKITTFSVVYALSGDLLAALVAGSASILPDAIEFPFKLILRHRTITHWPYLYMALILGLWWAFAASGRVEFYVGLFVALGAFLHVLEDGLSKTGIPLKGPFGPQYGLDLYKVYTLREMATAAAITLPCLGAAYYLGRFEPAYLGREVKEMFFIWREFVQVLL